jgi:hypothetical protein
LARQVLHPERDVTLSYSGLLLKDRGWVAHEEGTEATNASLSGYAIIGP